MIEESTEPVRVDSTNLVICSTFTAVGSARVSAKRRDTMLKAGLHMRRFDRLTKVPGGLLERFQCELAIPGGDVVAQRYGLGLFFPGLLDKSAQPVQIAADQERTDRLGCLPR